MDTSLSILKLASSLAAHSSARQTLVTENIANADTPGYRARDLPDFAEALDAGPGLANRATRPGHMDFGGGGAIDAAAEEVASFGAETPNGNSVSLEDQMMRAAEIRQNHDLALCVYRKTMDILRASLGR
jgi:flagellar basal-body rod protein FlgB